MLVLTCRQLADAAVFLGMALLLMGHFGLLAVGIASLATEEPALAGAFVVDNAASPETTGIVGRAPWPVCVLAPGGNLGCGGGVALGLREALRDPAVTHCWGFDDDAAEIGDFAALALHHHAPQRHLQVAHRLFPHRKIIRR